MDASIVHPGALSSLTLHDHSPSNLTTGKTSHLLDLPNEILDRIWAYCLKLDEGQHVRVYRDQTFICDGPKNISTALLRVNKQVHASAQDTLYRVNSFWFALGNLSCMSEAPTGHLLKCYSVPTKWDSEFRRLIYRMQRLCVSVMIGQESANHPKIDNDLKSMSKEEITAMIQDEKDENSLITQTAIEEFCNVLELSSRLREVEIRLLDQGYPTLNTGQEHRILKPFGNLRNVHRVRTFNVPKNFAQVLEVTMKRKRY